MCVKESMNPNQGDWVTIAKNAPKTPNEHLNKVYIVFRRFQLGIYVTWKQCHAHINKFRGASSKPIIR